MYRCLSLLEPRIRQSLIKAISYEEGLCADLSPKGFVKQVGCKSGALVAMCSSLAWDSPFFYRLGTYLALRSLYLHSIAVPPTQTRRLKLSFLVVEIENFSSRVEETLLVEGFGRPSHDKEPFLKSSTYHVRRSN